MWRIFRRKGKEKWYHSKDSMGGWMWVQLENLMYTGPLEFETRAAAEQYIFEAVMTRSKLIGVLEVERVP